MVALCAFIGIVTFLESVQKFVDYSLDRTLTLLENDEPERALNVINRAELLEPLVNKARAREVDELKCLVLSLLGQFESALQYQNRVITKTQPRSSDYCRELLKKAAIYHKMSETDLEMEQCQRALEACDSLDENVNADVLRSEIWSHIGKTQFELKQQARAKDSFPKALHYDPSLTKMDPDVKPFLKELGFELGAND